MASNVIDNKNNRNWDDTPEFGVGQHGNQEYIPQQRASAPVTFDPNKMTRAEREHFCQTYVDDRQRGRTDLIWLCNHVLQYKDVEVGMHGPVTQHLQHFNGREEYMDQDTFDIVYSEPRCMIHDDQSCGSDCVGRTVWYLDGPRFRMLLDPRGTLKTTVNTIAHSIQWIINFEDIRIMLSVATSTQGAGILSEVENHFRFNQRLRFLYPEFCPPDDKVGKWGSQEEFTVPNRRRKWLKEPTMRVVSIGKVVAGPHYEVIKHSDLVDKENVKTAGGIKDTSEHFKYTMPLLERGTAVPGRPLTRGWVDLEGTIYSHSDLYCEELKKDEDRAKRGQSCRWAVFRRDSLVNVPQDVNYAQLWAKIGTPAESEIQVLWAVRFPIRELQAIFEDLGEYLFNCQYRLFPSSRGMGLASASEIGTFPARFKPILRPHLYMKTTIDLAGMEEDSDGCNIAITTVGHAKNGRKYVYEALIGHPTPFEVIEYIFDLDRRYSTQLSQKLVIQVELAHHAQALMPFINREMELRGQFLSMVTIPRDNNTSKDNRIMYGLQPWFNRKLIWFSDDIRQMPHIIEEITKFPKFKFKDFLDTLADQAQTTDGKIDLQTAIPQLDDPDKDDYLKLKSKFLGFDPVTKQPRWAGDPDPVYGDDGFNDDYHANMTGVL